MNREKKDIFVVLVCIILIIYIMCMFIFEFNHIITFEKSKKSGNERWFQVENRILTIENSISDLKKEVEEWKK